MLMMLKHPLISNVLLFIKPCFVLVWRVLIKIFPNGAMRQDDAHEH